VEGAGFRHGKGSLGQHLDQAPVGGATWWREQIGKGSVVAYCVGCTWEWCGVVACIMWWEVGHLSAWGKVGGAVSCVGSSWKVNKDQLWKVWGLGKRQGGIGPSGEILAGSPESGQV
jgi:hypothetical protein